MKRLGMVILMILLLFPVQSFSTPWAIEYSFSTSTGGTISTTSNSIHFEENHYSYSSGTMSVTGSETENGHISVSHEYSVDGFMPVYFDSELTFKIVSNSCKLSRYYTSVYSTCYIF